MSTDAHAPRTLSEHRPPDAEDLTIEVPAARLSAVRVPARTGDPATAPVALLVPGFTGSKEDFFPLLGPLADRERVFDRLVRLDDGRDRQHGGAGLGLSIARALARAQGGDLVCLPAVPGAGARFRLTLPVVDAG